MRSLAPVASKSPEGSHAEERDSPDIANIEFLARLMDTAFQIPGIKLRFGMDAILGLLPGFGDFATSFISLYILKEAHRRGVSRLTLARMGSNILIDWIVGSIPVLGDAFDLYWKSNRRNVLILLEHEQQANVKKRKTIGDWTFLILVITVLVATLIASLMVSYWLVGLLFRLVFAGTAGGVSGRS